MSTKTLGWLVGARDGKKLGYGWDPVNSIPTLSQPGPFQTFATDVQYDRITDVQYDRNIDLVYDRIIDVVYDRINDVQYNMITDVQYDRITDVL